MAGKVVVFGDSMSQPSRACWWLSLLINVPNFEYKLIQIAKQQQQSAEYAKMHVAHAFRAAVLCRLCVAIALLVHIELKQCLVADLR